MNTKSILVPIDLTSVSINALRFAMECFRESSIELLHVREGMLHTNDPVPVGSLETTPDYWHEVVTTFTMKEMNWEKMPERVSVSIAFGDVVRGIVKHASDNNIDFIVMGTRDKYNYFDKWFGTISLGVVKTAKTPTYLIPKYAKYSGFSKTIVASDYQLRDVTFIAKLVEWNQSHQSYLRFLHIEDSKNPQAYNQEKETIVSNLFEKEEVSFGFELSIMTDKDVAHSLLAVSYNYGADLLVLLPDKQTFIGSLLFRSVSKDVILKSEVPLLFLN